MMNFKDIHIGALIKTKVEENQIAKKRILKYFNMDDEDELTAMYASRSLDTEVVLKWSKLLKYDFFRIYSQHLIFYKPPNGMQLSKQTVKNTSQLPQFKKSVYTKEIIDFVLKLIDTNEKTPKQIIREYGIPKTTLYRWKRKYNINSNKTKK